MKRTLLTTLLVLVSFSVRPQLAINNTETPGQLVLNTFLGENLSVSNIKFNGSAANAQTVRDQIAQFSDASAALSCEQGLILSTGKVNAALGPNNTSSVNLPTATPFTGDADLALISGAQVNNVCKLEFDFVPNGDTVLFEYIFASEEYPEFVNSQFNDTFGLFLSGPGISGIYSNNAKNIALIPSSSQPVSINTLNNGPNNFGPCTNCQYYVSNGIGTTPSINTAIQYDGRSTILTASGAVIPGATYHLKFAIANIYDNLYDSAMFLLQGSLRSATLGTQNFKAEAMTMLPNPATDFIKIHSAETIAEVSIYDLQGRTLIRKKNPGTDLSIDTTGLQAGTYIVECLSANQEVTRQKLVIKD
ncbi:choice-of-anchor L domain-containing protein [Flavobacterium sp.]|uniref:choice-of-anchor L domain-containing protein n=1 Tax=Flavobacterium sp. TaxID=239 RepID=UPI00260998B3|nr:choice-of-anchor L domain-containing protein [Flavobacterium sp.]